MSGEEWHGIDDAVWTGCVWIGEVWQGKNFPVGRCRAR